jgi:hypothetical protein
LSEIARDEFDGSSGRYMTDHDFEDSGLVLGRGPTTGCTNCPTAMSSQSKVPADFGIGYREIVEAGKLQREWAMAATIANTWPRRLLPPR